MTSLTPCFKKLINLLPAGPLDPKILDNFVKKALEDSTTISSAENRKTQWEYLLKNEIFTLAAKEGRALKGPDTKYYAELRDKLDLVLTFTENDACDPSLSFTVLQDLLETQTITSCSHIFSWIEERAGRLTKDMVPQKGKALVLLRTLNDLLRRLSKMGSTTIFCGRILTFLSSVFPLGERSGVNLRGEYGPTWEGVKQPEEKREGTNMSEAEPEVVEDQKMQVDKANPSISSSKPAERKEDFYNTFWSLQLPFSKPPLFASSPSTFTEFKEAVSKVLPVIREATTKERAMLGTNRSSLGSNASSLSLKRKREPEPETAREEYFFAKFLTNPDLLELEIADTHFRRQFLFQLLILLNHLLTYTKASKAAWAQPRNRSLQMDFTLAEGADTQWVQETISKASEELRQTAPGGPVFKETVNAILEREKNWVRWKNEICPTFDKEPWRGEGSGSLEAATADIRMKMREPLEPWKWDLGTEPLSEIWAMGYRDLRDLQNPFQAGDVKDFVKKIKLEDARINQRKKTLLMTAEKIALAKAKITQANTVTSSPTLAPSPAKDPPAENTNSAAIAIEAPAPTPTLSPSSALLSGAKSSLHPSLPTKPGATSAPEPATVKPASPAPPTGPVSVPPSVKASSPAPVVIPQPAIPPDEQINRLEENKLRWSWLGLRTARDQYLQHFARIGTGDLVILQQEIEQAIEKEKQERENPPVKGSDTAAVADGAIELINIVGDERMASPIVAGVNGGLKSGESEGDNMTGVEDGKEPKIEDTKSPAASAPDDMKVDA